MSQMRGETAMFGEIGDEITRTSSSHEEPGQLGFWL